MTSKELMLKTFRGEATDQIPVTPHWWGLYKFQLAGIISGYEGEATAWSLSGEELAKVDELFYETFKPDMFHLTTGASRVSRDENYYREYDRLLKEVCKLESKSAIDEFIKLAYPTKEGILNSGVFDHIRILSEKYGEEVFIALNEGNPICTVFDSYMGFVEGLTALAEKPDMMEYFIFRLYEGLLPRMEALVASGAHGYIGSETYCSCDIISPQMYRDIVFPAQQFFYRSIDKMGLVPIVYFLGDIRPIIKDIRKLGVKGLMVEESKKTFVLDIAEIYRMLEGEVVLFGNLDSVYTLLKGTTQDVERETIRQLEAAKDGRFIMANGSPICFDTPVENIRAMISAVRTYRR
ncbi:uroporphyrinogen-III decarboxylase [Caldicoprobacter guelmensis]|uniref:uroporphyrinogen decarboxylase family protein n=1 Tax=Caldicoprobacter guelmensis TaxID=1170224 RepID=UPI0019560E60|nr:uroporphyrinogen decarboxylase family protein [Caldicoprobacter guelmensis]MBM7582518.1 uroporphyrinogen-III decarboxylase [Caldicoprobacter guelmensis]